MQDRHADRLPWLRILLPATLALSGICVSAQTQRPTDDAVWVQNRLGYGPTPADTAFIADNGIDAWIQNNLLPPELPDPGRLVALRQTLTLPTYNRQVSADNQRVEIANLQIAQALYSRNQLIEQLTNFWEQHFSTNYSKIRNTYRNRHLDGNGTKGSQVASYFEWLENSDFRTNALGRFEDLLMLSGTGPAMMAYLDTVRSSATNPNENYGRELLELYTVGVANHTQDDVLAAAKIFTGLEVEKVHPDDYGDPFSRLISEADARALGDVDYSSQVDSVDEQLIIDAIAAGNNDPDLDVNGDGEVNQKDLDIVRVNLGTISWVLGLWYDPDDYVPGPKTFFKGTPHQFTIGGFGQKLTPAVKWGETVELFDRLAGLPMTAEFVSAKLIAKFVTPLDADNLDDVPPDIRDLLDRCITKWQATDGDIRQVLTLIFADPVFLRSGRWVKTETAFESVISAIRAFESRDIFEAGAVNTRGRANRIRYWLEKKCFYPFFLVGPPTGFPEESPPGSGNLLGRMRRNEATFAGSGNDRLFFDWDNLIAPRPGQPHELALDILSHLYGPRGTSSAQVVIAYDFIDALIAADPSITHAEMCDGLASMVSSYPRGFLQ